jgi:hypothetical protein
MSAPIAARKMFLLGSVVSIGLALIPNAFAASKTHSTAHQAPGNHHVVASKSREPVRHEVTRRAPIRHVAEYHRAPAHGRVIHAKYTKYAHSAPRFIGISCVPYARQISGIDLAGNANTWWDHAAGQYARGSVPERGSVLAFRSNPSMRLGHVAVVERVVNPREIIIDHANWGGPGGGRGRISTGIPVVDVSPMNDWTAVRVGLGRSGEFGSVYPTFGFIYDRPDTGRLMASSAPAIPTPALNPAPRDLRPASERSAMPVAHSYDEVAEAPAGAVNNVVYGSLRTDAPNRSIR